MTIEKPKKINTKTNPSNKENTTKKSITKNKEKSQINHISEDKLNEIIATEAYFISEKRGFAPGNELIDWLEAELSVKNYFV